MRPSDMAAFANDEFVVKDRNDLKVFDGEGNFQKVIRNKSFKSLFGCMLMKLKFHFILFTLH